MYKIQHITTGLFFGTAKLIKLKELSTTGRFGKCNLSNKGNNYKSKPTMKQLLLWLRDAEDTFGKQICIDLNESNIFDLWKIVEL